MPRDGIATEGRALGQAVARLQRAAPTTPVPRELRARIATFADRARGAGWRTRQIAEVVGVSHGSLRNWRAVPPPAFIPVVVTGTSARPVLTLVAPSGHRVDGLDVATAAALLRALA